MYKFKHMHNKIYLGLEEVYLEDCVFISLLLFVILFIA